MIPTLHTQRLTLRPPAMDDVPAYLEVMASERAVHMGGPFSEEEAWLDFCAGVAGWHLRGYGMLSIAAKDGPAFLGVIFMHLEWGDPERELGWILTPEAEGNGYAFEAAVAARAYAFDTLGWTTAVSYIAPANARSVALAERLGAVLDPEAPQPAVETPCLVYRHSAEVTA